MQMGATKTYITGWRQSVTRVMCHPWYVRARQKHPEIWLCLVLALAPILLNGAVLLRNAETFPWDFTEFHLPLATAYADAIADGDLPLWDPYTYCGRPLLANPQAAVTYPPMLLTVLGGRAGLVTRLEWLAVCHMILAGILTFTLARQIGEPYGAATYAGLSFELGAFFVSQAEHLGAVMAAPWLVLSWCAVLAKGTRRIPLLAVSWTLSFLCGFVGFTVMTVVSTVIVGVVCGDRRRLSRDICCGGLLAVGAGLVQLGPSLELVQQSIAKYRSDWLLGGGGIHPKALVTMLIPNRFSVFDLSHFADKNDPTQLYLFSGLMTVAMAIRAVARREARLAAVCVIFGILMLGDHTIVGGSIFRVLPPPVRGAVYWYVFMAPFLLAVSLLAARGLRGPTAFSSLACLLLVTELGIAGWSRPMNRAVIEPHSLAAAIRQNADSPAVAAIRQRAGDLRIDTVNDALDLMSGGAVYRWRAANGYDPLALEALIQARLRAAHGERWGAYYQIEKPDAEVLDAMSVGVLLSRTTINTKRLLHVGRFDGHEIYVNAHALPRYRAESCVVEGVEERRNSADVRVTCAAASVLETSEVAYSEWRATVDGMPAEMLRGHGCFRNVALPAGKHVVHFYYSIGRLWVCSAVSGLTMIVLIYLFLRKPTDAESAPPITHAWTASPVEGL